MSQQPKKAMILAAGLGTRMASDIPKPLQQVAGLCLIEYRILALRNSGITDIVINLHHKAEMIRQALGDGHDYGVNITYSIEEELLMTGGGIRQVLPLFNEQPFIVVNADVWTDYSFADLRIADDALAHLVLVDNPKHNMSGDFALAGQSRLTRDGADKLTYSGISVYRPAFFEGCPDKPFTLGHWLLPRTNDGVVTGEHFSGLWVDVGTPERLSQVQQYCTANTFSSAA